MPVPDAVKRACKKGIEQVEEGLGGDGLEPATVKEARSLAKGEMPTEAKIRKAYRWWARNERFLDAEVNTPADVSANLWGGSAGMRWFRSLYNDLDTSEAEGTSGKGMEAINAWFKAVGTVQENSIEAIASTTGNMDRAGDVIAPGAFKSSVLRGFVDDGALLVGHDWDDLPVGYIASAKIQGDQLISSAIFHSTPKGQEARTVAMERTAAGKSVSVSVGFMPDYDSVAYYESGKAMLKAVEDIGMDLTQFDTKGISAHKYGCRMIRSVTELFEWSIVLVGMNPRAKAIAVKDFTGGSTHGLTLETHLDVSLAGIRRVLDVAELRKGEGRGLSDSRLKIVREINSLSGEVLASHAEPAEKDDDAAKAEMLRRAELLRRVEATLNQL